MKQYQPHSILTKQQVADYYQVTTQTIDNWTKNDTIAAPKIVGTLKRWLFSEIEMK